jgi:hypothetical protein
MPRKASAQQQLQLEPVDRESPPRPQFGEDHVSRRRRSLANREFPRLALTFAESAAILGVSDEFFAQYVAHEVRFVRRGRKKLVAIRELERWLEESASRETI